MKEFNINDGNKTTSGFKTPEGYFDQFTVDLNNKLKLPKTEVKVISIKTKRRFYKFNRRITCQLHQADKSH